MALADAVPTDSEAKLYRKGLGQEARLSYLGHVLMENRSGLMVDAMVTEADGIAERKFAMLMVVYSRWKKRRPISTLGADKGYDTRDFVRVMREMDVRRTRVPNPTLTRHSMTRQSCVDPQRLCAQVAF
jgi:hypothetical protein